MSFSSSHYERLRVAEQASVEDIRVAWQAEVDRQRGSACQSPIAQAVALADIHAAYEVLSDPKRRAHYDAKLVASRGAEIDPAAYGLPLHSANDEDAIEQEEEASLPAPVATAEPQDALAASLRLAESLRGTLTDLTHDLARPRLWPRSPMGMMAVTLVVALMGTWLVSSMDRSASRQARAHMKHMSPQARQAHAQWLVASRINTHPLDGDPLPLRR